LKHHQKHLRPGIQDRNSSEGFLRLGMEDDNAGWGASQRFERLTHFALAWLTHSALAWLTHSALAWLTHSALARLTKDDAALTLSLQGKPTVRKVDRAEANPVPLRTIFTLVEQSSN
jgi:hypothetical protein